MADIDTIVFDKTGTITEQTRSEINFQGSPLTDEQCQLIRSLANQSNHPLSKGIVSYLSFSKALPVKSYQEFKGSGTCATIDGHYLKMGSAEFVLGKNFMSSNTGSKIFISIDHEFVGYFILKNSYRKDLQKIVSALTSRFNLQILSGDNDSEEIFLKTVLGEKTKMLFNQKPEDKLKVIKELQNHVKKVLMIGDGLNDAGAFKQSDVGIAISDNTNKGNHTTISR